MKNAPYSLTEAEKHSLEYKHLTGQPFKPDTDTTIECVTVAPFDEISKNRFILYYLLFDNPQIALNHDYKGLLFDVLVLASSPNKRELEHESLATWLANNSALVKVELESTGRLSPLDS
jgi:hypothetical protein